MRQITNKELARALSPAINLGNTLEALPTETSWGNPLTTQKIMDGRKAVAQKDPETIRAVVESGR